MNLKTEELTLDNFIDKLLSPKIPTFEKILFKDTEKYKNKITLKKGRR